MSANKPSWSAGSIRHVAVLFIGVAGTWQGPGVARAQEPGKQDEDPSRRRLIRKSRGQDDDDVMSRVIQLMQDSTHRLAERLDAGAETQTLQRRILRELDVAVRQARQNMRRLKSQSQQAGDQRQEGRASDQRDAGEQPPGNSQSGERNQADAAPASEAPVGGSLAERRRQWGNLPPRDRREILQGINDDVQPKYREQINRYYEALAETGSDD